MAEAGLFGVGRRARAIGMAAVGWEGERWAAGAVDAAVDALGRSVVAAGRVRRGSWPKLGCLPALPGCKARQPVVEAWESASCFVAAASTCRPTLDGSSRSHFEHRQFLLSRLERPFWRRLLPKPSLVWPSVQYSPSVLSSRVSAGSG